MTQRAASYNKMINARLRDVCAPLLREGITTFACHRYLENGTILRISTNLEWSDFYFEHKFFNSGYIEDLVKTPSKGNGVVFWGHKEPNHNNIYDALYDFDIWNGVTLSKRDGTSIVSYSFGTSRQWLGAKDFYNANMNFLKNFILYFEEKASDLIDAEDTNKLIHTKFKEGFGSVFPSDHALPMEDIAPHLKGLKDLSKQEYAVLYNLSRGKTLEGTSETLGLGVRTIESYFRNIKNKLQISSKSELLEYFLNQSRLIHASTPLLINPKHSPLKEVTNREYECLFYLARGKSFKEIGEEMELKTRTVESYIHALQKKLHLNKRASLVEFFLDKSGLILNNEALT